MEEPKILPIWKIFHNPNRESKAHVYQRGKIVLRATVTEKTTVGVVFIAWHFAEAAANLLTNDALDPQAKIPEFKACAVQVFPAREEELPNPENIVQRGRY